MMDTRVPALLYDGECGLCNGVVRFLIRHDPEGRLRFGPLQGPAAQGYLRLQGLPTDDFDSLVFVPDWDDPKPGVYLLRTSGALACFAEPFYRLVARTRYSLFGVYRPKPLPDTAWNQRFLDP
jgi:predicted DCC family thiol-disulfide oxidoreductase YuxK